VIEGASADFTVAASGSTPLSYQWFKDGVALVGANGAAVSIPTSAADAGKTIAITVRVSNGAGQVTSQAASLVVQVADTGTVSGLIIASEGGSLSTANGAATLDVPAGALSANTTLSLKTLSPAGFTLPEGATPVGEVIVVGPAGTVFSQPVGISIPTPEDIPDGFSLAVIELPDASGAKASGQKASAAAVRVRAQAITSSDFSCLQPQAAVGGLSFAAITQAVNALYVQVPSELCAALAAPLPGVGAVGKVPGSTTDACGADNDFNRPANIDPFEGQLVSRHVACGRFQESSLDVDVPAKDAQGAAYIEPKAAKMALDVMWSIHGKPGGGASKKLTLKIKQSIAIVSSNVSATTTLPPVKVLARTDCTAQGGPAVTCASTRNFDLPTNGVATFTLDIPFNWDASERAWSEFVPGLELLYSSDGAAPDTEVSGRTSQVYRGLEVRLRCDLGLAKAGSNGCVLPDAAPVLVLRNSDGPEAVQHMREAMDPNGPIKAPGAFKLKPGTRAIADPSVTDKGLQYAKLGKVRDRNRFASCNRPPATGAPGLIVTRPGGTSASCQANGADCQCDEYPFAASWNGGAVDPARTSVKMIKGDDNGNVGRKYGNWLVSQRVLDFTTFADGPFTPLDMDVPTYESADTFWIHIQ